MDTSLTPKMPSMKNSLYLSLALLVYKTLRKFAKMAGAIFWFPVSNFLFDTVKRRFCFKFGGRQFHILGPINEILLDL